MKTLPLSNLGASGINTDIAPWDLPPEYLTDGRNFRVRDKAIFTNGGWTLWQPGPANAVAGFIAPTVGSEFPEYVILGTTTAYRFDGSAPAASMHTFNPPAVDADHWTACMMGDTLVVNNPAAGMFWYDDAGNKLEKMVYQAHQTGTTTPLVPPVYWDPAVHNAGIVRSHGEVLFALRIAQPIDPADPTKGLETLNDGYAWSHPAVINGLPPTWDPANRFFIAGQARLGGDSGTIIDGLSMRDAFVIYATNSIHILEPSGDDLVWRRREYTEGHGLLAEGCVVEVKGRHYYMSHADILAFDGNSTQSIASERIRRHYQANLNPQTYQNAFAIYHRALKEIWFCIPTQGTSMVTLAYIYNWQDDSWAIRDLPAHTRHACYGAHHAGEIVTWQILHDKDAPPAWEGYVASWGADAFSPFDETVIGLSSGGEVFDIGVNGQATLDTFLERTNYPLDGHIAATTITAVYPQIRSNSPVRIRFGSHDYASSPVRWDDWKVFNPITDRKIEPRTTGTLHAWRVESIGDGAFEFAGFILEYADAGAR